MSTRSNSSRYEGEYGGKRQVRLLRACGLILALWEAGVFVFAYFLLLFTFALCSRSIDPISYLRLYKYPLTNRVLFHIYCVLVYAKFDHWFWLDT
ncbi:hypothetical protein BDQ17DRAFT_1382121 [Cyathus striatus]|nr:hypothetical protein BDQ17DRAFT_1382121 [Cyathus striatus]